MKNLRVVAESSMWSEMKILVGAAIFDQVNLVLVQVWPSEYSPSETRPSRH